MKNKKLAQDKYYYVSPLEIRHYLLDIPVTKSKYQYNAVKFALRSLYPGNEETTSIDYLISKESIIGIAANSERIKTLKSQYDFLVSPVAVINQVVKKGIAVYAGDGWLGLQFIENGILRKLETFSENQIMHCFQKYDELCTIYNITHEQKVLYIFDPIDAAVINTFRSHGFDIKNIDTFKDSIKLQNTLLFIKRNKSVRPLPVIICAIVFLVLFIDVLFEIKNKELVKETASLQTAYKTKKEKLMNKSSSNQVLTITSNKAISVYDIFTEIYKASPEIRILSFSMNDNAIKFEAENTSAIRVIEKLSEVFWFEDIKLHQSLPQQGSVEKFIISARVKK